MRLQTLCQQAWEADLDLVRNGLVSTFGNAIARAQGLMVLQPSGLPCHRMKSEQLVGGGKVVEGTLPPTSDLTEPVMRQRTAGARIASLTISIKQDSRPIERQYDRHFLRKQHSRAYYGPVRATT